MLERINGLRTYHFDTNQKHVFYGGMSTIQSGNEMSLPHIMNIHPLHLQISL